MVVIFRFSAERAQPQETSETKRESTPELSRFKSTTGKMLLEKRSVV